MFSKLFSLPANVVIELVLYPFFLFYRMPIAWIQSLWESRVLLDGRWSRYMGFHPHNAINSLFYRTQWININRYGRSNCSPVIGMGHYPLKNWFHLSLPASYIYANAGAVTTLTSTLVWSLSHLLWIDAVQPWWAVTITAVMMFSSTAYAMAFVRQNYQILGWMWLPLALLFTGHSAYMPAVFAWFAAGLSGITPIFFAIPIVSTFAISLSDPWLTIVLLPSLVFAALRFFPLFTQGGIYRSLISISKLIGFSKKNVRYDRGMQRLDLMSLYFMALYFISLTLMSLASGEVAYLPLLATILFLINQRFFRVADEESIIIITTTLFAYTAIKAEPNWLVLIALWLAVNPFGAFLSIQRFGKDGGNRKILINPPFDHSNLETAMDNFFACVAKLKRVYFAFNDPDGKYANLFDGYRVIHELPLNIASKREFHLFPDWWTVGETNYEGAPQCWGRSYDEVLDNVGRWNADYVVIYQESGSRLSSVWTNAFELVSEFDWGDYQDQFRGTNLWPQNVSTPKWFLLQPKSHNSSSNP